MSSYNAPKFIFDLPKAFRIVTYDIVSSTNDEAKILAAKGGAHGTIVYAKAQTAGRGRHGRGWESPLGNLFASFIIKADYDMEKMSQLCFAAALAVGDAVRAFLPKGVEINFKWPNDITVGGKKVAGILLESSYSSKKTADWAVVGIGVNVKVTPKNLEIPVTSLVEAGAKVETDEVMQRVIDNFSKRIKAWEKNGFPAIRKDWLASASGIGKNITVKTAKAKITGKFENINESGFLVLMQSNGKRKIVSTGDIFLKKKVKKNATRN